MSVSVCVCSLRRAISGDQWGLGRVPGVAERLTHGNGATAVPRKGKPKLLQSFVGTSVSGCGDGTATPALPRRPYGCLLRPLAFIRGTMCVGHSHTLRP